MKAETSQDIRFVVFHRPGPKWQKGVDFREQPGVMEHVKYYREWYEQGKLEMGGPFLVPDSGGMMIPVAGLSQEEVTRFAAADPAVGTGLLEFEVRPWYVAMRKSQPS